MAESLQLEELLSQMASRQREGLAGSFRLSAWRATVNCSYAVKRVFDMLGSAAGLLALSPLFLAVAAAVKLSSPGPAIFRQTRVGRYGRHFTFYKFRTMRLGAEAQKGPLEPLNESADGVIFKMRNDPRITRVGRFLRRTSLDELPQLWNVFVGDMSLVGPRPPLPDEVAKYTLEDRKRLDVIPGITGIWQISGRSEIPFKEQVRLDNEYILASGLRQDLAILLRTIPAIIGGKGAY